VLEKRVPEPEGESDDQAAAAAPRQAGQVTYEAFDTFLAVGRGGGGQRALRTQFTSHTRGFYAEGIGIIFDTEVQAAVVHVEAEDAPEPAEPDEWDAAEAAVRTGSSTYSRAETLYGAITSGGRSAGGTPDSGVAMIDPEFVDAAIEAVIQVLGKHGQKLDALPDHESVIVGLRVTPDSSLNFAIDQTGAGRYTTALAVLRGVQYHQVGSRRVSPQTVVIRIPKSALPDLDRGEEVDVRALRRKATITSYASAGSKTVSYSVGGGSGSR